MLGASEAATIGFNFQWTYCGYSSLITAPGVPVTVPAFGLDASQWVNLEPMCGDANAPYNIDQPYVLKQMVGVPNGSVRVTWSAAEAGLSLFRGYYSGEVCITCGPTAGEEQVYWGFLSDGLGFSNQAGYWVDVVGLKSLFTNSPFVVQLIASFSATTNQVQTLTNAFIIDPTSSTTQSVAYPNIPPAAINDDGGLSSSSNPLDTDTLRIEGNHAQIGAGPPNFYFASTLAGFIFTDQPVVTMSPQPAVATAGDTVVLRAVAIGVPPLACQWRKNGVPIPGATNLIYGATNIQAGGGFDLVVTNLYGVATSQVATVTVHGLSIGSSPPLVLDNLAGGLRNYGVNFGATWLASSQDSVGSNRVGVMHFDAATSAQIVQTIAGLTNLDFPQGTVMFWMRSAGTMTNNGTQGATLFVRAAGAVSCYCGFWGLALVQNDNGTIQVSWPEAPCQPLNSHRSVSDNQWHHLALVYDQAVGGSLDLYIDGMLDAAGQNSGGCDYSGNEQIKLGFSSDAPWGAYNGLLNDFRLYSRKLTALEIASAVGSDALVDTNALLLRWSFNAPPVSVISVTWPTDTTVLQSAPQATGPYSDVPLAALPYYLEAQSSPQFYRFRRTTLPAVIITNPYDM
jgi:hypothetical protein